MPRSDGGSEASLSDASDAADDAAGSPPPQGAADVADIRALLEDLSRLRLSMSAELSGAAGALEDGRRDIAASMVDSARRDLGEMRAAAIARGSRPAPDGVVPGARPATRRPLRRTGRALAGAVALALAVVLVPHLAGGSSSPGSSVTTAQSDPGATPTIDARLVSDEFEKLRQAVQSPDANPADVLTAARNWQRSLTASLAGAATRPDQAKRIVMLLRKEAELLRTSPQLRSPIMLDAANQLRGNADTVLTQLRSIADTSVLSQLPETIIPTSSSASVTASPAPLPVAPLPTVPGGVVATPPTDVPTPVEPAPTPSEPVTTPTPVPPAPTPDPSQTPDPVQTPDPTLPPPSATPPPSPEPTATESGNVGPLQGLLNTLAPAVSDVGAVTNQLLPQATTAP